MTQEQLMEAAEKVARQRIVVQNFGIVNMPNDLEKRVKLDAEAMVAGDKLRLLEREYASALRCFDLDTWTAKNGLADGLGG
jgi:hypothetical protein